MGAGRRMRLVLSSWARERWSWRGKEEERKGGPKPRGGVAVLLKKPAY